MFKYSDEFSLFNDLAEDVMREKDTSKQPLSELIHRLLLIAKVTPAR